MQHDFLKAEWRKLAMANYAVDPGILEKYLPYKTRIDTWNGTCYVSLVGFRFINTKLKGIRIPFHTDFEEVNLRFYVTYEENGEIRRGVVFIKEIVPRAAITFVANTIYNEKYETMKMGHTWNHVNDLLEVTYCWKKQEWHAFRVVAENKPQKMEEHSEEAFITEHYWGYTKITPAKTSEYEVVHPKWDIYPIQSYDIKVDFGKVYGSDFTFLNGETPKSVFLAEGSEIKVKKGRMIY